MAEPMNGSDLRSALARLDERQLATNERMTRAEAAGLLALQLSEKRVEERRVADWAEVMRRLNELNNSHETANRKQGIFEAEYIRRETFDRESESADARLAVVKEELVLLKTENANLTGKLWLPMLMAAGIAAGLAAAAVALLTPGR